eukprot:scaffold215467_cov18-Prasinocladus_malaysianus.AAC.1
MGAEFTSDAKLSTNEKTCTDGISARDEASLVEGNAIRRSQSFSETGLIDDRVKQGLRMVLRAGGSFSQVGMPIAAATPAMDVSESSLIQAAYASQSRPQHAWDVWCLWPQLDILVDSLWLVMNAFAGASGMQASPHPAMRAGW